MLTGRQIKRRALQPLAQRFRDFLGARDGNFAISFAVLAVPLIISLGVGVDFMNAHNVQAKMQSDLDAALLAAVKEVDTLNATQIKAKVATWFAAQTSLSSYSLADTDFVISTTNKTISAKATTTVPTMFMNIGGINNVSVAASSSVAGPGTSYMNVYLVVDKSPSMLLAAYAANQKTLRADRNITCEFACHNTSDPVYRSGTSVLLADSFYDYIKGTYKFDLRSDVALAAMKEVVAMIATANTSKSRIKVGLYTIAEDAREVLAPTSSTSAATSLLNSDASGLTSATSGTASSFDVSLATLQSIVGTAGDGTSAASPLKLVLLLTDGTQSTRGWVTNNVDWSTGSPVAAYGNSWYKVAPFNPAWCSTMKTNKVTVGVLYTEYLSIPSDWGYMATVGSTMSSAKWKSTWGGVMRSGVSSSITRRDYLPYALSDCATSEDLFLSASDPAKIQSGLASLFDQYLSSVRLTQ